MTESHTTQPSAAPLMLSVSGCRGIVGDSLTPETIIRYVSAYVAWIRTTTDKPHPTIVLACDGRQGGPTLARLVSSCLAASGCTVCDIGIAATPTVGVMVTHMQADGGLIVTASHNPLPWNGLKPIDSTGAAPTPERVRTIIELFNECRAAPADPAQFGSITSDDTADHVHIARILKAIDPVCAVDNLRRKRFRVLVDSVNAAGVRGAKLLLDALGCQLVHLNADQSGIFPHAPEPTKGNLAHIAAQIPECDVDVAFVQDPDADRLAILDADGAYIGEELTLVLAAQALLTTIDNPSGAHVCANLSTSRMIDDLAALQGTTVHRSSVGEANVVASMRAAGAILGGEGNGGVIWPAVGWIRDSFAAMALVLALMARTGSSITQIAADRPTYTIEKRKLPLGSVDPGSAQTVVADHYASMPGASIDTQDGIRIDLNNHRNSAEEKSSWVHVRPSNTEPILRLIAEAPTADATAKLLDDVQALIKAQ